MPSARTSDINTPEPPGMGVATMRSPTWPTVTRRNSSSPSGLTTLRVIVAVISGGVSTGWPNHSAIVGFTSNSHVMAAETG